jgi:putative Mn2+ efflux pump MntP
MSDYQDLNSINEDHIVRRGGIETFMQEQEETSSPFLKRFKKWTIFLMILALPLPVIGWFADSNRILFYQSVGFFVAQILLAFLGLRSVKANLYKRLVKFRKWVNLYFILLILCIIGNQGLLTYYVVYNNQSNCENFKFNKVCDARWGIMYPQLIMISVYPSIDVIVFVIYRYYLQILNNLINFLLTRKI